GAGFHPAGPIVSALLLVCRSGAGGRLKIGLQATSLPHQSKHILQRYLHLPVVDARACDFAEVSAAQCAAGAAELRRVQRVERLPPELDAMTFVQIESLRHG